MKGKNKMPDYCQNRLIVRGDEAGVCKLWLCIKEDRDFDFDRVVHRPLEYKKSGDAKDDGCIENQGATRNVGDAEGADYIYVIDIFSTTDNPPTPVIKKMIELFPSLEFEFEYWKTESGLEGILSGSKGKVERDASGIYYIFRGRLEGRFK